MYLNKMIMNRLFHTCKQLIGIAALSVELYACDWIHDDSLPLCEFRLYFKYDYNMKFAGILNAAGNSRRSLIY